jgi:hypothetical protein
MMKGFSGTCKAATSFCIFVLLFSMAWWVVTDKWGGVRIVVEKTVKESEFCSFPQMLLLQFCIPTF